MTLLDHAQRLQDLASGPKILEAVDTYYADDVEIVEGDGQTFHGKETQKGRIQSWMDSVEEIHDSGVRAIAANETTSGTGTVLAEVYSDVTFTGVGRQSIEEVAVQRWEDGKVVHERFYYNMPSGDGAEA